MQATLMAQVEFVGKELLAQAAEFCPRCFSFELDGRRAFISPQMSTKGSAFDFEV